MDDQLMLDALKEQVQAQAEKQRQDSIDAYQEAILRQSVMRDLVSKLRGRLRVVTVIMVLQFLGMVGMAVFFFLEPNGGRIYWMCSTKIT